jgi:DNA-binding IclR family transcriptional regulator
MGMRTLDRIVAILNALAERSEPNSATGVAKRTGLSLSTAARLLRNLAEAGLIERAGPNGTYVLGTRLLTLGRAGREGTLLEIATPIMGRLRDETGETVSLHRRVDKERVCIAEEQSHQGLRRVVPPGFTVPLHFGATGEVLLAGLADPEIDEYLKTAGFPQKERASLKRRLHHIRELGWTMAVGAWSPGLSGLAAAVRREQTTLAALSVSGPSFRWTRSEMRKHVNRVLEAAHTIAASAK